MLISQARCYEMSISNTEVAYDLYRKKQQFGGATLRNYRDVLENNGQNVKLDETSRAIPVGEWDSLWWEDFKLQSSELD